MADRIDERDIWLFRELYSVLACFADASQNSIDRIGGGRISVPDDQANDLDQFSRTILEKYPDATDLEVMRVTKEIDAILSRRSLGGEAFDEFFRGRHGKAGKAAGKATGRQTVWLRNASAGGRESRRSGFGVVPRAGGAGFTSTFESEACV